jgi:membrane-associated phospholipid phosphatase
MKFVSGIFHPLLMATYCLIVLYFYHPAFFSPVSLDQIPRLLLAVFVTTCVIPVLSILIMKFTSRISSLEMSSREERSLPFISILMFYGATTYLFISRLGMQPPLSSMMIGMTTLIGLLLIITFWQKISIHAAAGWAFAGLMTGVFLSFPGEKALFPMAGSTMMAGLVSSSRLYLKRHTDAEVWSGSLLGYTIGMLTVTFFG